MFGRFSPFMHSFVCLFVHMLSNHLNIFIRDVKPENLLVGSPGTPTESIIHMVYNLTTNHNDCFCAITMSVFVTTIRVLMPMTNCDDIDEKDLILDEVTYQVDFGLAAPYKDDKGAHILYLKQHLLAGTPRC